MTERIEECDGMPGEMIRENAGIVLSILGFLYAVLVGVVGWISKRLSKLRDHDEAIRRLTDTQLQTAEILTCMRADQAKESSERREEDGKIYARLEANAARYGDKLDQIRESLHDLGLKVERAIRRE